MGYLDAVIQCILLQDQYILSSEHRRRRRERKREEWWLSSESFIIIPNRWSPDILTSTALHLLVGIKECNTLELSVGTADRPQVPNPGTPLAAYASPGPRWVMMKENSYSVEQYQNTELCDTQDI